ncbi:hypothetical protein QR97_25115 [Streptomyces sp. PBH53]|nr:hypothetical protein QR97_25115 [Streptomyces sp. PBH53]
MPAGAVDLALRGVTGVRGRRLLGWFGDTENTTELAHQPGRAGGTEHTHFREKGQAPHRVSPRAGR